MKPFDLKAFKAGQKALTRNGWVATFVGICEQCDDDYALTVYVETAASTYLYHISGSLYAFEETVLDLVSMVSRHQALIDAYNPEDTWQFNVKTYDEWFDIKGKPEWEENREFRIHPHNDLIKAWKKGAKIETMGVDGTWHEVDNPMFYEDSDYRIKPELTIHCLAYDAKRLDHKQTKAVRARVVKKEIAEANGWKIIQEWEV